MLLTLITILGYPEWFTHFSSPQPSPPELNSEFWHPLVFSMGFLGAAEGIWQMASPHPSPPCPKLHFLCSSLFCSSLVPPSVSQFPAGTSMGALGGFGPCQDPGWAQLMLVGIRNSQISLHPLWWGWRDAGGAQCCSASRGLCFSVKSSINYLHLVEPLAFMTQFYHNFFCSP